MPSGRSSRRPPGADAIAHLVAILDGSDEQFQAVNVGGTRNVIAAARAAGVTPVPAHERPGRDRRARAPDRATGAPSGRRCQAVTASDLDWTVFEPELRVRRRRRCAQGVRGSAAGSGGAGDRRRPLPAPAGVGGRRGGRLLGRARAPARRSASATSWAARRCSSSTICWTSWPASPAARRGRKLHVPAGVDEGPGGAAAALPAAAQGHPRTDRDAGRPAPSATSHARLRHDLGVEPRLDRRAYESNEKPSKSMSFRWRFILNRCYDSAHHGKEVVRLVRWSQDGRVEVLAGRGESLNRGGIAAAGVGIASATS